MRRVSLSNLLGASLVLAVPLGPAFRISLGEQGVQVLWTEVIGVFFLLHLVRAQRLSRRRVIRLVGAGAALVVAGLLGPSPALSLITIKNIVFGAILGSTLAWSCNQRVIRRAVLAVLLVTAGQLVWIALNVPSVERHALSNLSWGRSNYLAVVSLAWVGGILVSGPRRLGSLWPAAVLTGVVLMTGSRGALLAMLLALCVHLISIRGLTSARAMTRMVVVAAVLLAVGSLAGDVIAARQQRSNAADNVAVRGLLVEAALSDFVSSPLIGTGTGALDTSDSDPVGGVSQRYAHSTVPSLLQQFGIMSLPILGLLAGAVRRALRSGAWLARPMIVGLLVFSSVEIILEGVLGSLYVWWFLEACVRSSPHRGGALLLPRKRPVGVDVG